jgi:hypothetical protein
MNKCINNLKKKKNLGRENVCTKGGAKGSAVLQKSSGTRT